MSSARQIRDSGRQRLSTVESGLNDYVATVFDGAGIEVELTYGTLRAVRLKPGVAAVMCHGRGGGYCWERQWTRKRLANFLAKTTPEDPVVRRGPPQVVWPR